MTIRTIAIALALAATFNGTAATAQDDILLTVTGPDGADLASYDMAALEALGTETFETSTLWTDGVQSFTGVPLDVLLADLGVTGGELKAQAINDYAVAIPVSDAVDGGPMVAFLANGEPMSIRDKGPLLLIYPFDADDAYQTEVIYSRSIWQLNRIQVVE